ncbi:putative LmbE-like protein [Acidovorax sp. CF316]|uniref:PIG-L deacetylase family protein n=1 Tax=Acidovorax sp. CF316 TaxID=1144317 RepID=UPI00026BE534|nr:PIG-L deacetylase family protein [Acidovorax sp. CF316]EJE50988.1 putative LmbE-like protein [Acidovorax sp. CF316]
MGAVNHPAPVQDLAHATRFISAPRVDARFWQSWLCEEGIERVPANALVGKWQRLVVVAPHPDDEILACGALLHSHVAQGGTCLVVAVTDGEASHADAAGHDAQALVRARQQESAAGLQRLAVPAQAVTRLGLPDGKLLHRAEELQAQLAALIHPSDVVLTTWRLDGHPDHEACGRACAQACQANGATLIEAPVWMWHWAEPWDPQVDWTRLTGVGIDADTLARKLHALAAHRSQLTPRSPTLPPVLDAALIERAGWDAEYFFTSRQPP